MIAVDASALCAIAFDEPDRDVFADALQRAEGGLISPLGVWEARVVLSRNRGAGAAMVAELMRAGRLELAAIRQVETDLAFDAWRRYGKGRHPAALNLGDCFAYALDISRGLPLLYKGDDFAKTDVASAL